MTQLCYGKVCDDWRKDRCERCSNKSEQMNSDAPRILTCRTKAGAYPLFRWTPKVVAVVEVEHEGAID
jgi:hypothetical protein